MRTRLPQRLFTITTLGLLLAAAAFSEPSHMVVAGNGTVMKLHSGVYKDLFPEGRQAHRRSSVLALDIVRVGENERLLVPESEDRFVETPSALFYEKSSGMTFLLWEALFNGVHPVLYLTSYDGASWSDVIQITGGIFADKGDTNLVIVPESGPELNNSESPDTPLSRTAVYVVWEEKTVTGSYKFLAPIILKDGSYPGWHSSFRLSDFLTYQEAQPPAEATPNAEGLLEIRPSASGNGVTVAFVNPESGRLVTFEVEMLPRALSDLAEYLKEVLAEFGATAVEMDKLIARLREAVLERGVEFHRGMLEHLMDQVELVLREQPTVEAATTPGIIDKAGIHFIEIGAKDRGTGLIDPAPLLDVIQFGQTLDGGAPYHHLKISLLADREMVDVGSSPRLFLSATGHEALIAWLEGNAILYRETEGVSWGETQMVEIQDGLDQEIIYQMLAERALNR